MVDVQLGLGAVPRGLPHVVEHSEGVSDLVETVLDVTLCSSIIPYRAAQVRELLRCRQVFSVNMNWFRAVCSFITLIVAVCHSNKSFFPFLVQNNVLAFFRTGNGFQLFEANYVVLS